MNEPTRIDWDRLRKDVEHPHIPRDMSPYLNAARGIEETRTLPTRTTSGLRGKASDLRWIGGLICLVCVLAWAALAWWRFG